MVWATRWGADTVMDLSTGRRSTRRVSGSPGTLRAHRDRVPIYLRSKRSAVVPRISPGRPIVTL